MRGRRTSKVAPSRLIMNTFSFEISKPILRYAEIETRRFPALSTGGHEFCCRLPRRRAIWCPAGSLKAVDSTGPPDFFSGQNSDFPKPRVKIFSHRLGGFPFPRKRQFGLIQQPIGSQFYVFLAEVPPMAPMPPPPFGAK